jgi:hypothetical protein
MEPNSRERFDEEWLDAALKQYGQAEPRAGLENRVLASLRIERERAASPGWQWWPAVGALTAIAMITVGMFLVRLNRRKTQAPVAREIVASVEVKGPEPGQTKQQATTGGIRTRMPRPHRHVEVEFVSEKREQFPSPEPLSEQEQILARYIQQFPREATLMARAQTELDRQEMLEQPGSEPPSSDVQNQ